MKLLGFFVIFSPMLLMAITVLLLMINMKV